MKILHVFIMAILGVAYLIAGTVAVALSFPLFAWNSMRHFFESNHPVK
jgi:hypothetical protein